MPTRGAVIAAPASGSGKTLITLGLIAALRAQGHIVAAAKSGPDYIDLGFLTHATKARANSLDPWAMRPQTRADLLAATASGADYLLIEGAVGLFDGAYDGSGSTADLAAECDLPVILVLQARGLGKTAAALLQGLADYRDDVRCVGVIFNQAGSADHQALLAQCAEEAGLLYLGSLPHLPEWRIDSRHLGLTQAVEYPDLDERLNQWGTGIARHVDLQRVISLLEPVTSPSVATGQDIGVPPLGQRIAIARDTAFSFLYPHFLTSWRAAGADISFFSPLADEAPAADADAIFLPGGYQELHAEKISQASIFLRGIRERAGHQTVIYGECGGYMTLGQTLKDKQGAIHPMAGLLPVHTSFHAPKRHLGYRHIRTSQPTILGPAGMGFRGHEFHYSSVQAESAPATLFQVSDSRGRDLGVQGHHEGRIFGSFLHLVDKAR